MDGINTQNGNEGYVQFWVKPYTFLWRKSAFWAKALITGALDNKKFFLYHKGMRFDLKGIHFDLRGIRFDLKGMRFDVRGIHFDLRGKCFDLRGKWND